MVDAMRFLRRPVRTAPSDGELDEKRLLALRDEIVAEAAGYFEAERVGEGAAVLARLEHATVDERTLAATDQYLRAIAGKRRIVGTTDLARVPTADEVVIVYGNFPHSFENVVVNNPIRRHVGEFSELPHDTFEFDRRWDGVSRIVVINAEHRLDRYDAVMRELANARAPLDRVVRFRAVVEHPTRNQRLNGRISCMKSHLTALEFAAPAPGEHVLILEDDFCFTSDVETHLDDLATFFDRRYDYVVCLLGTSKYGRIEPRDDLVSESRQPCTNGTAYLVSGDRADRLLALHTQALAGLIETRDEDRFSNDRYWALLGPEGMLLVFRRKLGFQAAGFSDIESRVVRYLD
jgi:hypothetical protein